MGVFYERHGFSRWRVALSYPLQILAVLMLCVAGGLLNRMRGGWKPYHREDWSSTNHIVSVLVHDGVGRAIISGPTGLLVGLCMLRLRRGVAVALFFAIITYFSYFVGWGVYFSLGHDADAWASRVGVFDWLVGRVGKDWDFDDRWALDVAAMSLRGLVQTSPTGLLLFLYGYGWLPMISGIMMGPLYSLAFNIPSTIKNFEQGTPVGEFLWGCWIWLTLLVALGCLYRPRAHAVDTMTSAKAPPPLVTGTSIALHVFLTVLDAVFVTSCVSYGMVKQSDPRNRDQTLVGLAVCTAVQLALHLVLIVWQVKSAKPEPNTYDYASPLHSSYPKDNMIGGLYGTLGDTGDLDMDNPASPKLRQHLLEQGWGEASQAAADMPVHVVPNSPGSMELFARRPVISDSTIAFTSCVHTVLCVPPDRGAHDGDMEPTQTQTVGIASTRCASPLGACLMFLTAVSTVWMVACLVLVVYDAVRTHHYFGCVPDVPCVAGPWPSS